MVIQETLGQASTMESSFISIYLFIGECVCLNSHKLNVCVM
jgi:hypothetical protein